ncbi:palmitoyltransferase ZDHHC21-like isoform X2 [Mercenaria mercenaria]|uniref:palmitoyltransferase ZDHHC21-like isoform X2 n=1 Tax=Mercenaria mercenaria TaxID=6596 RepID=UPI00234F8940|nr:palmitoyltransferase ZDHHC21-like isoform X2 [Mercenaria mercenaria]
MTVRIMMNILSLKKKFTDVLFLDRFSQSCFLFGLVGIATFGILFAIPYMYNDFSEKVVLFARAFGVFLAFQMLINWFCMKFVDNGYNPDRDGTMPDGIQMGQNISRIPVADSKQTSRNNRRSQSDLNTLNKRNVGSVMYVASELPKTAEEQPKRTTYPYFSWTPCLRCNRPRPPRCHHCPQCNVCVLKRDHHCHFAGACIGYKNLRHFSVFLFWASVATVFSTLHAVPYYYYHVIQNTSFFDLIFPVAIARSALGYISWKNAFFIVLSWILVTFLYWATSFLQIVVDLIRLGKTTFERDHKMELTDKRCLSDKLRSVYGNYWILNFIIPLHFVFEPIDDPLNWPYIKA